MSSEPDFDITAPLAPLRPGELPFGLYTRPIYRDLGYQDALPLVWLRVQVLRRLLSALTQALRSDCGLLIWDGWRPRELQRELWFDYREQLATNTGLTGKALEDRLKDFVSDPDDEHTVPAHVTGGAVDLTLCDKNGAPLEMGGTFDELTERSHPDYYEQRQLSAECLQYRDRRRLLHAAMTHAGFWRLPTEWWHFEWGTEGWAAAVGGTPRFQAAPPPP